MVDRLLRQVNAHQKCYQMMQKFGSGNVQKKAACSGEVALIPRSRKAGGAALISPVREVVLRVLVGRLECWDQHTLSRLPLAIPRGTL